MENCLFLGIYRPSQQQCFTGSQAASWNLKVPPERREDTEREWFSSFRSVRLSVTENVGSLPNSLAEYFKGHCRRATGESWGKLSQTRSDRSVCYEDEFAAKRSTALSTAPQTKPKGRVHPKELSLNGNPGRQSTEETQRRKLAQSLSLWKTWRDLVTFVLVPIPVSLVSLISSASVGLPNQQTQQSPSGSPSADHNFQREEWPNGTVSEKTRMWGSLGNTLLI